MTRWKMLSLASILFLAGMLGFSGAAAADGNSIKYEVTVTNLTQGVSGDPLARGIVFTPMLIAAHRAGVKFFAAGEAASTELQYVAETGNTAPLKALLDADPKVAATAMTSDPLLPGASVTVKIESKYGFDRISLVGMLLPTNDGFLAVSGAKVPYFRRNPVTVYSPGYDAGTEVNDELCASIPGPHCNGSTTVDGAEGYVVHIHPGIRGGADLDANDRAWLNPVAKVTIRRVR